METSRNFTWGKASKVSIEQLEEYRWLHTVLMIGLMVLAFFYFRQNRRAPSLPVWKTAIRHRLLAPTSHQWSSFALFNSLFYSSMLLTVTLASFWDTDRSTPNYHKHDDDDDDFIHTWYIESEIYLLAYDYFRNEQLACYDNMIISILRLNKSIVTLMKLIWKYRYCTLQKDTPILVFNNKNLLILQPKFYTRFSKTSSSWRDLFCMQLRIITRTGCFYNTHYSTACFTLGQWLCPFFFFDWVQTNLHFTYIKTSNFDGIKLNDFVKWFLWKTALTPNIWLRRTRVWGNTIFPFHCCSLFFWSGDSLSSVLITAPYRPKGFDSRHRWKRCIRLRSVSNHFHLTGTKATYLSPVTCLSDFSVTPVTTEPWIFWRNWIAKNQHWCSVLVFMLCTDYIRHLCCLMLVKVGLCLSSTKFCS